MIKSIVGTYSKIIQRERIYQTVKNSGATSDNMLDSYGQMSPNSTDDNLLVKSIAGIDNRR